ncbi:MAG: hypothetical protein Q8O67_23555 [Deltaproteobacteria bacterium]|nr:hypothetical protein [Deltaproteobacteria bacterium]
MKKRLGEILMERDLIDADQLNAALAHQRQWGMRLGTALVAKGFVAEGTLTRVLSDSLGFPMVDLSKVVVDPKALALVPRRTCEAHDVLPLALKDQGKGRKVLLLAMADPLNAAVVDEIGFTTDTIVKPAIAQISSLEQAIRRYYLGQRVDIAPLNFDSKQRPNGFLGDANEPMTITGRGAAGGDRVIVGRETVSGAGANEPLVIELRDEEALPPGQMAPVDPFALPVDYLGQRTGVFAMPGVGAAPAAPPAVRGMRTAEGAPIYDADILSISKAADSEQIEALEKKFWALMRVLARRGLVTKEEFLTELRAGDE